MSESTDNVLASTVFVPSTGINPVTDYYVNNLSGANRTPPDKIAVGHYRVTAEGAFVEKEISINTHATNAAGDARWVEAVPSTPLISGNDVHTTFDLFVRTAADALTDDALFVEFTVSDLPLAHTVP